jgi:FkbM family methyltransferase
MRITRKNRTRHYDFIEIGTSDFNTLIQKAGPQTVGLSVEPLSQYLDRLPDKPRVQKVNAAASNRSGSITIYYVPDSVRKEYDLPSWMKGTNSIGEPHKTVVRYLEKHDLPMSLIHRKKVKVMSVRNLFKAYGVGSVDFFKVDTEGHDVVIVNALIDLIKGRPALRPHKIQFESNALSNRDEVQKIATRLTELGYTVTTGRQDTIAILSA